MSEPYVGEIRMFAGNFAPAGWAFCDGSLQQISENEALFSLIGTTYGGDGQETYALPNLNNRVPIHQGTSPFGTQRIMGESAGVESVTLTTNQIPVHNHTLVVDTEPADAAVPSGKVLARAQIDMYTSQAPSGSATLDPGTLAPAGGSQPHDNLMPYVGIHFIISLFGFYPNR
jgi:microcystin-dependent protein